MKRFALLLLLGGLPGLGTPALADDLQALELADRVEAAATPASPWSGYAETSLATHCDDRGQCAGTNARVSANLRYDGSWGPSLRAVLETRLDLNEQAPFSYARASNTLKEASLAWQSGGRWRLDGGRLTLRYGVAQGFNPTDVFRANALRTLVAVDPASMRVNRLGVVAVRAQSLWDGGSVAVVLAPKLGDKPSAGVFSVDAAAVNDRDRLLIMGSQKLAPGLSPQWLYLAEGQASPRVGANLTWAVNGSTIGYAEWMGGRRRAEAVAPGLATAAGWRSQWTAGATVTLGRGVTLTGEYQYNGHALKQGAWRDLGRLSELAAAGYLMQAQRRQEPPNRDSLFVHLRWPDFGMPGVDVSALWRANLNDHSHQAWVEVLRRFKASDLALQWQVNSGASGSQYGMARPDRGWQLLARFYF